MKARARGAGGGCWEPGFLRALRKDGQARGNDWFSAPGVACQGISGLVSAWSLATSVA